MITTEKINGKLIRLEWEINDQFDDMGDGHETCWTAVGSNLDDENDHNSYCGTAIMIDGEFTEINDIYIE